MAGFRLPYAAEAFTYDPSSKRTKRIEDPAHLAFIRKLPSVLSGQYGCDPCHIRTGSALHRKKHTGGAQKPDDCWTIPLTREEHDSQHSENELQWWRKHGIDPFELAIRLYEVSGDVDAATAIARKAKP
jgi:hypothetical protein